MNIKKCLSDFYRKNRLYFEKQREDEKFLHEFEDHIKRANPKIILDVGCGSGHLANELAMRGYVMGCVDLSPVGIKIGKEISRNIGANLTHFIVGDAENLPLRRECVDLVISNNLLEHLIKPQKCMYEMARVARKSIIVSCPNSRFASGPLTISKIMINPGIAFRFGLYLLDYIIFTLGRRLPTRFLRPDLSFEAWSSDKDAVCAINIFKSVEIVKRCGLKIMMAHTYPSKYKILRKIPILRLFDGQILIMAGKQTD